MQVQFDRKVFSVVPAIVAAAYATGDVIGTLITVSKLFSEPRGAAILHSLVVSDKANQKSALDIYFFNAAPVTSIGADNAAFALASTDLDKLIGRFSVLAADYVTAKASTNAEATYKAIDLMLEPAQRIQDLYIAVVSRGSPTYASATDLTIKLGLER